MQEQADGETVLLIAASTYLESYLACESRMQVNLLKLIRTIYLFIRLFIYFRSKSFRYVSKLELLLFVVCTETHIVEKAVDPCESS